MSFFSASKMYTSELEARTDEQKWETTLKQEHRFNAETLDDPLFDIPHGAREEGKSVDNSSLPPLPYARVIRPEERSIGKGGSVSVALGGRRTIKNKKQFIHNTYTYK